MTTTSPAAGFTQSTSTNADFIMGQKRSIQNMTRVCSINDLIHNTGICALVDKIQVAIFLLKDSAGNISLHALSNWDPIGKANVMYRGLIGSINDDPVICSPLYKQHYSLLTGKCTENDQIRLSVFSCCIEENAVFVSVSSDIAIRN